MDVIRISCRFHQPSASRLRQGQGLNTVESGRFAKK